MSSGSGLKGFGWEFLVFDWLVEVLTNYTNLLQPINEIYFLNAKALLDKIDLLENANQMICFVRSGGTVTLELKTQYWRY